MRFWDIVLVAAMQPSGTAAVVTPYSGVLELSGDMNSGTDTLLLSGDMQSGTDALTLSGNE